MSTRSNAAWNIAYRVFSIILPLVTAPYLSRVVGMAGVGLYSYAWSISEIFVIIAMLGLTDYGVRTIAKVKDNRDALNATFSGIFRMQITVSSIVLIVWFLYVFFVANSEKTIALHLSMMSISCLINLDWCLMGLGLFKPIALRNILTKTAAAVCVFIFIDSPEKLWIYGFSWSLATLIGCLLCLPALRGRVSFIKIPFYIWKQHFKPCALLLVSVLAVRVYRTMDKIMLGYISGMEQNGLYENAEKIIYCLSGFISAIGSVLMPKISNMLARGENIAVKRTTETSMHIILCMTCGMAFGLAAVSSAFVPLFYGDSFQFSAVLMIPLGFTLIMIGFANVIRTHWILPTEKDQLVLRCVLSGAAVNFLLNLILIPSKAAIGAVIATLAAQMTVPVMQFIYLRKELPYSRYILILFAYLLCGGIMYITLHFILPFLPQGWLGIGAAVGIGCFVYALACFLYWIITRQRSILKALHFTH